MCEDEIKSAGQCTVEPMMNEWVHERQQLNSQTAHKLTELRAEYKTLEQSRQQAEQALDCILCVTDIVDRFRHWTDGELNSPRNRELETVATDTFIQGAVHLCTRAQAENKTLIDKHARLLEALASLGEGTSDAAAAELNRECLSTESRIQQLKQAAVSERELILSQLNMSVDANGSEQLAETRTIEKMLVKAGQEQLEQLYSTMISELEQSEARFANAVLPDEHAGSHYSTPEIKPAELPAGVSIEKVALQPAAADVSDEACPEETIADVEQRRVLDSRDVNTASTVAPEKPTTVKRPAQPSLQAQFKSASDFVKTSYLEGITNEEKLECYKHFKQATTGDYTHGKKPGMLDFTGKAKYNAWKQAKGQTKEQAMAAYVKTIDMLKQKYNHTSSQN